MDISQLILIILASAGFISAIVLRFMAAKYRVFSKFAEIISFVLFDVTLLLFIVNGLHGMRDYVFLFIFISAVCVTLLRIIGLARR